MSQTHCELSFSEAIENEDIKKVSLKAASTFTDCLSQEEIKNCIHGAIWNATLNYNPDKKNKFTTYLYRGVVYECLKCKKSNSNNKAAHVKLNSNLLSDNFKGFDKIDIMDEIKSCADPDLLIDRFFHNFTLNEMAKTRGVSKETVRFKLKKNLDFLKNRLS